MGMTQLTGAGGLPTEDDGKNIATSTAEAGKLGDYSFLNELAAVADTIASLHGFTEATPGEDIALMHSELSEGLEDIRAGLKLTHVFYTDKTMPSVRFDGPTRVDAEGKVVYLKPCGVPSELADVIIRIAHFAGKHEIDLSKAVREKMIYNATRPFKHGGKTL